MNAPRIQWDGLYLAQAIDDEIELAWVMKRVRVEPESSFLITATRLVPKRRGPASIHQGGEQRLTPDTWSLPMWRRSWTGAGPLIGELGLSIRQDDEEGTVSVGNGNRRRDVTEHFADHPNKDAAICAAIVRAAIRVCTEARESD